MLSYWAEDLPRTFPTLAFFDEVLAATGSCWFLCSPLYFKVIQKSQHKVWSTHPTSPVFNSAGRTSSWRLRTHFGGIVTMSRDVGKWQFSVTCGNLGSLTALERSNLSRLRYGFSFLECKGGTHRHVSWLCVNLFPGLHVLPARHWLRARDANPLEVFGTSLWNVSSFHRG